MADTKTGKPVKLPGLHRAVGRELTLGHRDVKMLRPICDICAPNTEKAPREWYRNCPHEPYVGARTRVTTQREYEDVLDAEGNPTGERIISGTKSATTEYPWPNYVPVSLTRRHNYQEGPGSAKEKKGYIFPSELRTPAFPNGIADSCQFRECFWQEDLKTYGALGTFCQEQEVVTVYGDVTGVTQEVHNPERRKEQRDGFWSRARALVH